MERRFGVRRARAGDMDRILEIESATFGVDAYDRKLFAEYTRSCGDLFLVVLGESKVIGYAIACLSKPVPGKRLSRRAELVSIAVDPAVLGRGPGPALMESLMRRLKLRGVERLGLTVKLSNERARAFYEKYGFRRLRRAPRYYEDGEDGLLMVKDLSR